MGASRVGSYACYFHVLAAIAGSADADDFVSPRMGKLAGHVYINMKTGERTVSLETGETAHQRTNSVPLFVNDRIEAGDAPYFDLDTPTIAGRSVVDWGDIAFDSRIDALRFAYGTTVEASPTGPVEGLTAVLLWFDCENGCLTTQSTDLWRIDVHNLQGAVDATEAGSVWIYTLDLGGSGLEFEIGDTDGTFEGVSGESMTGCDLDDTDGYPLADFGWGHKYVQGQDGPRGYIGPVLAVATCDTLWSEDWGACDGYPGEARGIWDSMKLYLNPDGGTRDQLVGRIHFGRWPFGPFASTYTVLFGPPHDSYCDTADYNSDTDVDILDFLDFLNDFGNCENQPAPCGLAADADVTGDTTVDILDFLEFFGYFGVCS